MLKNKDIDIVLAHNASQVALGNSPKIGDGDTKPSKVITAQNQEQAIECKNLVVKLNHERKEREKKRQELLKLESDKLAKEVEERQRKIDDDKSYIEAEKVRKKEEIEKKIKDRIDQRQISLQRMVKETKRISKRSKLYEEIEKKFTEDQTKETEAIRFEKLKEIKAQHVSVTRDDISNHARKYEDIIRQKKEELRAKRGGLEIIPGPIQGIAPP